jgi:hypothetical protein
MKAYVLCSSSVNLFCAPLLCASSVPCSILCSSSISRRIDAHHQFCITAFFFNLRNVLEICSWRF